MLNIEKSLLICEGGWIQLYMNTFFMKQKQMLFRKSLKTFFPRKHKKNKTTLIRILFNLKYKDGNNMVDHISSFQGIVNKLVAKKMNIDDKMQASLLLSSLPDSWETFVVTVSNSTPNEILTMENVKDSLLNERLEGKKNVNLLLECS